MEIRFATKATIFHKEKVLILTKSSIEDVNPNTVDIPGGRLEPGEMPHESLLREVKEETGLDIKIIKPARCWSFIVAEENFQLVGVTYYCKFLRGIEKLSDEHSNYVWIGPLQILKGDYPEWLKSEISIAWELYKNEKREDNCN